MVATYPSDSDVRTALVERADEFCRLTGKSRSEIGLAAIKDGAFIPRVATGRNFTMGTYSRVMAWLDANWPAPSEQREQAAS